MEIRHSLLVGILGRYVDRFTEFQPSRTLVERLKSAAEVPGAHGVELVYPSDFEEREVTASAVQQAGLAVSAVNLNVKTDAIWRYGSFTNPDKAVRQRAVQDLKAAMDLAADLESHLVTVCPLMDGWDYSFQVDYQSQWEWLIEGLGSGAEYRDDVRVSIEYKPFESRHSISVPDVGTTLHLCERIGLPNIGVTMDVGHALIAHETPAMSASMAHSAGRLFYVHFNDNNRQWDWDMVPGSVHLWEMVETLFYLDRMDWSGWFAYDVFTKHGDPVDAFASTIRAVEALEKLVERLGRDELQDLIDNKTPAEAAEFLVTALVR